MRNSAFAILVLAMLSAPAAADVRVDAELVKALHAGDRVTMLVYLDERADLRSARNMTWRARGHFVRDRLVEVAERSQAPLRAYLDQAGVPYRAFWISNVIVVEEAGLETLNAVQALPGIRAIKGESGSRLMAGGPPSNSPLTLRARGEDNKAPPPGTQRALGGGREGVRGSTPATNIAHIRAPEAWQMGYTGKDVTVGIIDSGARHTHEALVNQYRGHLGEGEFEHDYNWYDPEQLSDEPRFAHPHGTHVTGTAVGGGEEHAIGVAPGARWIACLGCPGQSCPDTVLLECAQFMAAPTDTAGNNADPDRRPHVVNNSWGDCGRAYNDWFQGAVDAWIAAGIVPVFSAGNAQACNYSRPPDLNTVSNPARYGTVLGVGSTGNGNGEYATHSNRGPTDHPNPGRPDHPDHFGYPDVKPNVVAPGVNIFSSIDNNDSAYQAGWTGTSMSAPHVAGLVALMLEAAPCLERDYAQIGGIIMRTARPVEPDPDDDPPTGFEGQPNNTTGWGEIDAVAAVEAAIVRCQPGFDLEAEPASLSWCAGEEASFGISVVPRIGFDDPVTLSVSGLPPEAEAAFAENPVVPNGAAAHTQLLFNGAGDAQAGNYQLKITGESTGENFDIAVDSADAVLDVVTEVPAVITELTPAFGSGTQPLQPDFTWQAQTGAAAYRFQLADNRDFQDVIVDEIVADTSFTLPDELEAATLYFWRVAGVNACGEGELTRTFRFVTRPAHGECPLGTDVVILFQEDFGGGVLPAGWSTDGSTGGVAWTVSGARSVQGDYSAFAGDIDSVSDQRLITPTVPLLEESDVVLLNFENWQSIEAGGAGCFDGAVVEISGDGGATWSQPGGSEILERSHDGVVDGDFLNPLAGKPAWCGDPRDFWERYSIDISQHAGQSVNIRFRFGTDNSIARVGWYVDTVEVKACFELFSDRFE